MGGGLLQLVVTGPQDVYLTGNPEISFFNKVYRRHTNFSIESIRQTFTGKIGFGKDIVCKISRSGDLINKIYIEHNASNFDTFFCANYGSALIKQVELLIGGQPIDKQYGHWMEVWSELSSPNETGFVGDGRRGVHFVGSESTLLQRTSLMGGIDGDNNTQLSTLNVGGDGRVFIPLQFWFCKYIGTALPLISLQYHEVELKIKTESINALSGGITGNIDLFDIWVDYIFLDTEERRRFSQVKQEYLIEQLQMQEEGSTSSSKTSRLNFSHPVKELIWTPKGNNRPATVNEGPTTPGVFSDNLTAKIQFNGTNRINNRDITYFTRVQVNQHHSGYGGIHNRDSIAVYSFSLNPEQHQPSGTCNFSKLDVAKIIHNQIPSSTGYYVYALNYNVLRIENGMGSLLYAN